MENPEQSPRYTVYGTFSVSSDGEVFSGTKKIAVPYQQRQMLFALLETPGQPMTRADIAKRTRQPYFSLRKSRSLDICACRLRISLGFEGWRIQNIRGVGYRFDPSSTRNTSND